MVPFILVSAEKIPDYNNPYAPIFFDQAVYSWTDKIKITIIAPSWNTDTHLIDDIGVDSGHHIKISSRTKSLEPFRLTETGPNTGIFSGEVILTGFSHDVDGDKKIDTNPRTTGTGPTNGYLESERDTSVTVSFEFANGVVLTNSVPITWNTGKIKFLNDLSDIDNPATIQLVDRDLNLNPEAIDHAVIKVFSDSDIAGITIDGIETSPSSGIFQSTIFFTMDSHSSGNRLHVKPGDLVTIKYDDYTLPKPYSTSDHLEITTSKKIEFETSPQSISINKLLVADNLGNPKSELKQNDQFQIVATIQNQQNFQLPFVYLIQVTNDQNSVVGLLWIVGVINPDQILDVSQSWMADHGGHYKIETFVWSSLQDPIALSNTEILDIFVK